VAGHGRLISPTTRDSLNGAPDYMQNAPTGYNTNFVCRNYPAGASQMTVNAGSQIKVQWFFTAAHVGDCFTYLSYDVDAAPANQKWFKISEHPQCNQQNNQPQTVTIPDWVPAGRAVLRWEWYALHQWPSCEFYAQCVDLTISRPAGGSGSLGTPLVTVPDNLPNGGASNYRNPFNPGSPFFLTGPALAKPSGATNAPTQGSTPAPTQGGGGAPTPAPTTSNVPCSPLWGQCGGKFWGGATCCAGGSKCSAQSEWYAQCIPAAE